MTPDPADLAREPNADYERGVRDGRVEGWRKAKEAALIAVDRHDDICDEDQLCYCPCAAKIESAIRNLPEEPERNAK